MMTIIHPLRIRRILQGKTQWDMAIATGMSQTQISLIETGKITDIPEGIKEKIASVLNEDPKELFPESEVAQCA